MQQCAVYPNAVAESRKIKPEIPENDEKSTAIRNEIELDWLL